MARFAGSPPAPIVNLALSSPPPYPPVLSVSSARVRACGGCVCVASAMMWGGVRLRDASAVLHTHTYIYIQVRIKANGWTGNTVTYTYIYI